jgi:hypothetical protein
MSTVRTKSTLKPRPPVTYPSWTDHFRWELGPAPDDAGPYEPPSDEDRRWAAKHLNEEPEVVPDDATLEDYAGCQQALARMELGLKD